MSAPEKWGPAACPRCAGAPWFRDELCPGCEEEEFSAAAQGEPKDPMPPFPQEPAPGSAEAVEQAARAIADYLFTNGSGRKAGRLVLESAENPRGPDLGGWCRNAVEDVVRAEVRSLAAQRDEARLAHECSEATLAMAVARLGGTVEDAPTHRGNFLQRIDELRGVERERDELRAEVERLRADLEESEHCLNNGGLYLGEQAIRADKLEAQRDALADALEAFIPKGCECSDNDCLTACVALRLAGRLP